MSLQGRYNFYVPAEIPIGQFDILAKRTAQKQRGAGSLLLIARSDPFSQVEMAEPFLILLAGRRVLFAAIDSPIAD